MGTILYWFSFRQNPNKTCVLLSYKSPSQYHPIALMEYIQSYPTALAVRTRKLGLFCLYLQHTIILVYILKWIYVITDVRQIKKKTSPYGRTPLCVLCLTLCDIGSQKATRSLGVTHYVNNIKYWFNISITNFYTLISYAQLNLA